MPINTSLCTQQLKSQWMLFQLILFEAFRSSLGFKALPFRPLYNNISLLPLYFVIESYFLIYFYLDFCGRISLCQLSQHHSKVWIQSTVHIIQCLTSWHIFWPLSKPNEPWGSSCSLVNKKCGCMATAWWLEWWLRKCTALLWAKFVQGQSNQPL